VTRGCDLEQMNVDLTHFQTSKEQTSQLNFLSSISSPVPCLGLVAKMYWMQVWRPPPKLTLTFNFDHHRIKRRGLKSQLCQECRGGSALIQKKWILIGFDTDPGKTSSSKAQCGMVPGCSRAECLLTEKIGHSGYW
ncbi:hypothetical protein STEG23_025458, partial [Scotinomys teguina]